MTTSGLTLQQLASGTSSFSNISGTIGDNAELARAFQAAVIIDMQDDDYTMSDDEAASFGKIITNAGDGTKTLTWPSTSDGTYAAEQFIYMGYAANKITLACQTVGATTVMYPGDFCEITVFPGGAIYNMGREYSRQSNRESNGVVVSSSGAYAFDYSDCGKLRVSNNGGAHDYTMNAADELWPINAKITVFQAGTGNCTLVAGLGVNLFGDLTMAQNESRTLWRSGSSNNWYVTT